MPSFSRLPAGTLLTIDQVADMTQVDHLDVSTAIESRALRATQQRGQWQVRVEDVRRWLARR